MDNSPFGKLSPELRNEIWELVLVRSANFAFYHNSGRVRENPRRRDHQRRMLALTTTCQKIHNEATPIFYSLNSFKLRDSDYGAMTCFSKFCAMIGPANTLSLRSVTLGAYDAAPRWKASEERRKAKRVLHKALAGIAYHPDCEVRAVCDIWAPYAGDHGGEWLQFGVNLRGLEDDWKVLRPTTKRTEISEPVMDLSQD